MFGLSGVFKAATFQASVYIIDISSSMSAIFFMVGYSKGRILKNKRLQPLVRYM